MDWKTSPAGDRYSAAAGPVISEGLDTKVPRYRNKLKQVQKKSVKAQAGVVQWWWAAWQALPGVYIWSFFSGVPVILPQLQTYKKQEFHVHCRYITFIHCILTILVEHSPYGVHNTGVCLLLKVANINPSLIPMHPQPCELRFQLGFISIKKKIEV